MVIPDNFRTWTLPTISHDQNKQVQVWNRFGLFDTLVAVALIRVHFMLLHKVSQIGVDRRHSELQTK